PRASADGWLLWRASGGEASLGPLLDFLNPEEVRDLRDHASDLGPVVLDDGVVHPMQAQRPDRCFLVLGTVDDRANLGEPKPGHCSPPGPTGPAWRPLPPRRRPHLRPWPEERSDRSPGH